MKIFKIYSNIGEYVVLKCPHCKKEFRTSFQKKVFGKERKNAKCQKCEKLFDFNTNQLDEDTLTKAWNSFNDKEMIMIKPNGEQKFFKREKNNVPKFTTAEKLGKRSLARDKEEKETFI